MEELRIDCLHQTEEELGVVKELRQNIFRLNHTMPDTEEYRELLHKVFPHFGENCRIEYDRCRKSSQVNQENIDYGFFGKSHFNKVNFITKSFEPRSKVVAGLSFYLCWQNIKNKRIMKTMNEKVTMVTGAAAGIGLVSAEAFAKAGATVVLVDINEPKEQAEKLVSEGYKAVAYRCDVSDTRAVKEMIDWIVATYGRLDAALNNAGIQTPQRPMAEITDEEFDRTVAVDLKGVWNCMRYEIIQMLKQGGGAIVNTSSQGGVTGFPGQAAYIACKHAVIGLTRTAAIDYSAKGIRINAVCPGVIRTPMAEELIRRNPDLEKELVRDIPAGRLGKPEEIANAVLWLCSPQASFVDGHALLVDGAFSIH